MGEDQVGVGLADPARVHRIGHRRPDVTLPAVAVDAQPLAELEAFDILSIGMSGDWPLALQAGSNMVRIGSAIFGERS